MAKVTKKAAAKPAPKTEKKTVKAVSKEKLQEALSVLDDLVLPYTRDEVTQDALPQVVVEKKVEKAKTEKTERWKLVDDLVDTLYRHLHEGSQVNVNQVWHQLIKINQK